MNSNKENLFSRTTEKCKLSCERVKWQESNYLAKAKNYDLISQRNGTGPQRAQLAGNQMVSMRVLNVHSGRPLEAEALTWSWAESWPTKHAPFELSWPKMSECHLAPENTLSCQLKRTTNILSCQEEFPLEFSWPLTAKGQVPGCFRPWIVAMRYANANAYGNLWPRVHEQRHASRSFGQFLCWISLSTA